MCSIYICQNLPKVCQMMANEKAEGPSLRSATCLYPSSWKSFPKKRSKKAPAITDRCLKVFLICFLLLCKFSCPVISFKPLAYKEAKTCVAVLINETCEVGPCRDSDLMPYTRFCVIDYKRYIRSL